ncbi:MAG: cytochrome c-type biogenesis protein CcmH [Lautropia sp.]|nr:cytochrome c-type biogenesis protein CcmH [Lautropia sp.]
MNRPPSHLHQPPKGWRARSVVRDRMGRFAPGRLLFAALLSAALLNVPTTWASDGAPTPDDEVPTAQAEEIIRSPRFRQLAHELRCLVCQNQTLLDSHAPLAQDLRHEVVRLIASGRDDGAVKQYLVDRYGEFVLYRPSWSWQNALLWIGPALMLLVALVVGWRFARRGQAQPAPAAEASALSAPTTSPQTTQASSARQPSTPAATAAPNSSPAPAQPNGMRQSSHAALAEVDALLAEADAQPPTTRYTRSAR